MNGSLIPPLPSNTAVLAGVPTNLICTTNTAITPVQWAFKAVESTGGGVLIYNSGIVQPPYTRTYSVTSSIAGQYNISILATNSTVCGLYRCVDNNGVGLQATADVIVIG